MSFKLKEKCGGPKVKPCLKITIGHGDMVVMHGTDIHKFYEAS
jgi:hypothetical protein